MYEREELAKLLKVCDTEERLWFEVFLMTGCREQEVMHVSWPDVNLSRCTVAVRYKKEYGFSPKNYREREIPIPATLCNALKKKAKGKAIACALVFPTSGCKPKINFLDELKAAAERVKLDPDNFWLHKFRATFATWSLWPELIFAQCSNGLDTQIWKARCVAPRFTTIHMTAQTFPPRLNTGVGTKEQSKSWHTKPVRGSISKV